MHVYFMSLFLKYSVFKKNQLQKFKFLKIKSQVTERKSVISKTNLTNCLFKQFSDVLEALIQRCKVL